MGTLSTTTAILYLCSVVQILSASCPGTAPPTAFVRQTPDGNLPSKVFGSHSAEEMFMLYFGPRQDMFRALERQISLYNRDYYWKDYFGMVPPDGLAGGTDKAGNPTYVGQAYIQSLELLPAIIYPGCKFANTTAHTYEVTTDKNIKVLCSRDKRNFEWVRTKHDEQHLLINRHLVVGGSEIGQTLKIGRVLHNGQVVIGKVFSYPLPNSGLWIPYDGTPIRFLTYEILTYNQIL